MNQDERNLDDILNTSEAKDFLFRAERDMFPKMKQSALCLSINVGKPDAKMALEIGAALLFNKPLVLLCHHKEDVPPKLVQIAEAVIEFTDMHDPETQRQIKAALERVLRIP